jgi:hypothetical protein
MADTRESAQVENDAELKELSGQIDAALNAEMSPADEMKLLLSTELSNIKLENELNEAAVKDREGLLGELESMSRLDQRNKEAGAIDKVRGDLNK